MPAYPPPPPAAPLHGAGKQRSEDWWKALFGLLLGQGLVEYKHCAGKFAYSAPAVTQQGGAAREGGFVCVHVCMLFGVSSLLLLLLLCVHE